MSEVSQICQQVYGAGMYCTGFLENTPSHLVLQGTFRVTQEVTAPEGPQSRPRGRPQWHVCKDAGQFVKADVGHEDAILKFVVTRRVPPVAHSTFV